MSDDEYGGGGGGNDLDFDGPRYALLIVHKPTKESPLRSIVMPKDRSLCVYLHS